MTGPSTATQLRLRRAGGVVASVILVIFAAIHVWLWQRWIGASGLPLAVAGPLTAAGLVGFMAMGLAFLARATEREVPRALGTVGFTWLGLAFLALTLTVLTEPVRWFLSDPARATLPAAMAVALVGLGAYGSWVARRPRTHHVPIHLPGLHPDFDGFRIVQLSDVHIGPTVGRAFIQDVVDRTNALGPDLVVITGDLVDGTVPALAHDAAPLAGLRAPHGVLFITGNHEYFSGAQAWVDHLPTLGMKILRNASVTLRRGDGRLHVAGVDDLFGPIEPGHGMDLDAALAGLDPEVPTVLLAHQPTVVVEAARRGVALQLSGHTHNGQIFPFGHLVRRVQPWMAGHHVVDGTQLYVHSGTGYWGPPLRIGAPGEIAVLQLRAAP